MQRVVSLVYKSLKYEHMCRSLISQVSVLVPPQAAQLSLPWNVRYLDQPRQLLLQQSLDLGFA